MGLDTGYHNAGITHKGRTMRGTVSAIVLCLQEIYTKIRTASNRRLYFAKRQAALFRNLPDSLSDTTRVPGFDGSRLQTLALIRPVGIYPEQFEHLVVGASQEIEAHATVVYVRRPCVVLELAALLQQILLGGIKIAHLEGNMANDAIIVRVLILRELFQINNQVAALYKAGGNNAGGAGHIRLIDAGHAQYLCVKLL